MKKKLLFVTLPALLLCVLLGACMGGNKPTQTLSPAAATPSAQPGATYRAQDARAAFDAQNQADGVTGQTPRQTLLVSGSSDGLAAIILYTDTESNTDCNIAYIYNAKDTIVEKVNFASNADSATMDFVIADESKLSYTGDGVVTITVKEVKTEREYLFSIKGEYSEAGTNFTVDSAALA